EMEEDQSSILVAEGAIKSVKLSLSTEEEIVRHFGYIELPVPVYHPCHVSELRQLLSLVCLKCLRIKKGKVKRTNGKESVSATSCYYCRDLPALSLKEVKTTDGAIRLELKAPHQKRTREGSWNFLDKYGFHYGGYSNSRTLLPAEVYSCRVLNILKKIPDDTRKKLASRGYIVQSGYVMKYLPVPPNCLYIPEFTDGQTVMSYDISIASLKKVLQKIEQIKRSRSGSPNFESHDDESLDLQLAIGQYIHLRGTTRGPQDNTKRFAVGPDSAKLSSKQCICLRDFNVPKALLEEAQINIQKQSLILEQSRCSKTQFVETRVENNLKGVKQQISDFIARCSNLGLLIDPKKDSAMSKVVQQLGFVGLQLYREGKLYSNRLVEDCFLNFVNKHPALGNEHPPEAYGLVRSSYFHGLNPYEELVHAISTREAIVRSSRGLTEPGTLFKNLMAILRDVVICYDGTVRNTCSNSIIQLKYGESDDTDSPSDLPPGEPEILQTKVGYKNDVKDRKVILFLNDCSCPKRFCKERAAIAVQGCLKRFTLADCATDICIEHQKHISLDETPESAPTLVGHIHLDKEKLEMINISPQDILQKCQELSDRYAKKKGQLCHLFKKITFSTRDCSFTQKPIDGKLQKIPCLQFCFSDVNTILSESIEKAVNLIADSVCSVLLDTIIKGDPRIQEAKIIWVESDTTTWVQNKEKVSKGEPALEIIVEKDEAVRNGDAWRTTIDACIPVLNLIDTQRSIPYGIQQVKELLGISCAFDQVVQVCEHQSANLVIGVYDALGKGITIRMLDLIDRLAILVDRNSIHIRYSEMSCDLAFGCESSCLKCCTMLVTRLSTTVKMVAKNVLKDHLILVANSMTCTGNLIGFNTGGYKATFRSLKVQVPFTESTLFTPMKCFEKAAEKCDSDSLGCVVSSCSWGKHAAVGTGSSFQILWNDNQLKNNKEYGDGLYDFLALVRTDQEKAGYTFLDDVDYFVEENAVDDVCLSPEPDGNLGKPTFEDNFEEQDIQKGSTWENGTTTKSSWEQDASGGNDSGDWGGWSNGAAAAANRDQDNSCWDVPAAVEDNSSDWGGWGTEKPNDKKLASGEPAELNIWSDKGAKMDSNGGDSNWEKKSSTRDELKKSVDQDPWGNTAASPSENTWDKRKGVGGGDAWEKQTASCKDQEMNVNQDSWSNKTTSPSKNTWDKRKSDGSRGHWEKKSSTCNEQILNINQDSGGNAWAEKKSDGDGQWEMQPSTNKRKKTNADHDFWNNMMPSSSNAWVAGEGDGRSNTKSDAWSSWGHNQGSAPDIKKSKMEADDHSRLPKDSEPWNAEQSNGSSWEKSNAQQRSWGNSAAHNNNTQESPWDRMAVKDTNKQQDSWDTVVVQNNGAQNDCWDSVAAKAQPLAAPDSWGNSAAHNNNKHEGSWDKTDVKDTSTQEKSWDDVAIENNDVQNDCWDSVAAKAQPLAAQDTWGNPIPLDNSQNAALVSVGTTNSDGKQPDSWDAWNAAPAEDSSAVKLNEANDSGNNKGWKSDGWGAKTGNWRCERNNPGRPPRRPDERGPPMPRQRFELTTEEKNILLEVEPIVLRVRRIFREACDGVKLAPEDDKFIKEKVLEHHPEKQRKVSGEIDHIMVNKHEIFQDTRCFFVVSTDGSCSDFSYLKCMENFVRKNYTEDVDSFCMKYLRPRRRQAPEADGGTAPDTQAEAPQSTSAEAKQGTPAPPERQLETPAPASTTPPETPASPAVAPQGMSDPDSTGNAGVLEKLPDLSPNSPAASAQETPNPDSKGDAVILGQGPDPTPASPAVVPQETSNPESTGDAGILGRGPDPTPASQTVVPQETSNPE
ncbi:hypothetical protein EJB05_25251, partial [Eragrostis curvula]